MQFCETERQAEVFRLRKQGLTYKQIAERLNVDSRSVYRIMRRVKERAAKAGYSPEHDWNHPVPDGHKIKGVSTFYDDDGRPVRQWVKSQTDEKRQFEILIERLEEAHIQASRHLNQARSQGR